MTTEEERTPTRSFNCLGYTFRPRRSKNRKGKFFVNFTPAVSNEAAKKMRQEMRRWHINQRSDKAIDDLARMWNPVLRGWIQYYGRFYKSALYPTFRHFNGLLVRWAMRKYTRLRRHRRRAEHWLGGIARREPRLIICGADGVVVDLPLIIALECRLCRRCQTGGDCPVEMEKLNVKQAAQRLVNLMGAWNNQLLEILGAMGMREVRRLRGEVGRAMFVDELQNEIFAPLFARAAAEPGRREGE